MIFSKCPWFSRNIWEIARKTLHKMIWWNICLAKVIKGISRWDGSKILCHREKHYVDIVYLLVIPMRKKNVYWPKFLVFDLMFAISSLRVHIGYVSNATYAKMTSNFSYFGRYYLSQANWIIYFIAKNLLCFVKFSLIKFSKFPKFISIFNYFMFRYPIEF